MIEEQKAKGEPLTDEQKGACLQRLYDLAEEFMADFYRDANLKVNSRVCISTMLYLGMNVLKGAQIEVGNDEAASCFEKAYVLLAEQMGEDITHKESKLWTPDKRLSGQN